MEYLHYTFGQSQGYPNSPSDLHKRWLFMIWLWWIVQLSSSLGRREGFWVGIESEWWRWWRWCEWWCHSLELVGLTFSSNFSSSSLNSSTNTISYDVDESVVSSRITELESFVGWGVWFSSTDSSVHCVDIAICHTNWYKEITFIGDALSWSFRRWIVARSRLQPR